MESGHWKIWGSKYLCLFWVGVAYTFIDSKLSFWQNENIIELSLHHILTLCHVEYEFDTTDGTPGRPFKSTHFTLG